MRRFSIPLGLLLAVLSLLAVATPARAEERPLKGSGSGVFDFSLVRLNGHGNVTHLGRSSLLVVLDQDAWVLEGDIRPQLFVFTAANADQLAASVERSFFDPQTGILAATLSFFGGNGRFEDASGRADVLIVFDEFLDFDFVLEGMIDY